MELLETLDIGAVFALIITTLAVVAFIAAVSAIREIILLRRLMDLVMLDVRACKQPLPWAFGTAEPDSGSVSVLKVGQAFQPADGRLDVSNPPRGGSGVPKAAATALCRCGCPSFRRTPESGNPGPRIGVRGDEETGTDAGATRAQEAAS